MREFEVAAGRSAFTNGTDVEFKLGDDVMTAKAPTTGQLTLFFRGGQRGGMRTVESLIEFFSDVLSDADWRKVENHLRDGMDLDVLSEISVYLIGEWSGPPYETVARLDAIAQRYWPQIDGEASRQGSVELLSLPIDRFYNAVQSWSVERVKDPERWLAELARPLGGGVRKPAPEEIEREGADFLAFASAFGVTPPKHLPDAEGSAV